MGDQQCEGVEKVCASWDPFFQENVENEESPCFSHLTAGQQEAIRGVIRHFSEVLNPRLGLTDVLEYEIQLEEMTPVRLPPYRLAPPKMKVMKDKIAEMLKLGIIRPSRSNFSSPISLVPKGESDFRPVVDYRVLNSKIHIESVPLPDIHSCFHWFGKAKFFTSLDLNSTYHQIPLKEESRRYTAFATDWNLYEYCRVPFGIAVGTQVLTRLLDKIFSDIKLKYLYHYLDDLVVYAETFEEHVQHVREVLERLRRAKLTVKLSKVSFATPQLEFLGHIVGPRGVQINPERGALSPKASDF